MYLETERLVLYPMTDRQLMDASQDLAGVARFFGAKVTSQPGWIDRLKRKKIYRIKHDIIAAEPKAWLLATMWLIVGKDTFEVIGEAGFKGQPIQAEPYRGEVEIGYSTNPDFRGRGYMTEAVGELCRFAFGQTDYHVSRIVATTRPDNLASHRVLEKNSFARDGERGEFWLWVKGE